LLSSSVEQNLKDLFFHEWTENMNSTSKGLCYIIFKTELKIWKYIYLFYHIATCSMFVNLDVMVTDNQKRRWHNVPRADRFVIFAILMIKT